MYYLYELHRARQAHQVHGGVLLDLGEMYLVCSFDDAVELRSDDLDKSIDQAHYWAMMGECGYDETDPLVRHLKACLLGGTHEVLVEAHSEPGTYLA